MSGKGYRIPHTRLLFVQILDFLPFFYILRECPEPLPNDGRTHRPCDVI